MKSLAWHFLRDEAGATAIEYGLIGAIVSIAIVMALMLTGPQLEALYGKIYNAVASAQ